MYDKDWLYIRMIYVYLVVFKVEVLGRSSIYYAIDTD